MWCHRAVILDKQAKIHFRTCESHVFDERLVQHAVPQIRSTAVTTEVLLDLQDFVLGSRICLDMPWQKFQVNRFG